MVPVPALLRPHLRATLGTPHPHYLTVHAARRGAEAKKKEWTRLSTARTTKRLRLAATRCITIVRTGCVSG